MGNKLRPLGVLSLITLLFNGCGDGNSEPTGNQVPVAKAQSVTLNTVISKEIKLLGTDANGDTLTYTIVSTPTLGTLSGKAPNLVYTTTVNDYGSDSFTFKVNDGKLDSSQATVKISIKNVAAINNQAPTVEAGVNQTVIEGDTVTLFAVANDVDGNVVDYIWKESSTNVLSGNQTFNKSNFSIGTHTITLIVTDDKGATATDTVTVVVNAKPKAVLPILKTGQVNIFINFDDGYYQKGVDVNYTRDDINQIVTDHATNLQWLDDGDAGQKNWQDGNNYCSDLELDGGGWHLPTMEELSSLLYFGIEGSNIHPIFENEKYFYHWSSTRDTTTTNRAWSFTYGITTSLTHDKQNRNIRCTRTKK